MNTEFLKAHMESIFGPPRARPTISRVRSIEESRSNTAFVNTSLPTRIEVTNATHNISGGSY